MVESIEDIKFECPFCESEARASQYQNFYFDWDELWWRAFCTNEECKANKPQDVIGEWDQAIWMEHYEDEEDVDIEKDAIDKDVDVKDVAELLESSFWLNTLKSKEYYSRLHDDHDGTMEGKIHVYFDDMGDGYVATSGNYCLRFRTDGGGGRSLRVRNALLILAEAIRLDNEHDQI